MNKSFAFAFGFIGGAIGVFLCFLLNQPTKFVPYERIADFWAQCYVEQPTIHSEAGTITLLCPDSLYIFDSDSIIDTIWVGTFPGFISQRSAWARFILVGKRWMLDTVCYEKPKGGKRCQ